MKYRTGTIAAMVLIAFCPLLAAQERSALDLVGEMEGKCAGESYTLIGSNFLGRFPMVKEDVIRREKDDLVLETKLNTHQSGPITVESDFLFVLSPSTGGVMISAQSDS